MSTFQNYFEHFLVERSMNERPFGVDLKIEKDPLAIPDILPLRLIPTALIVKQEGDNDESINSLFRFTSALSGSPLNGIFDQNVLKYNSVKSENTFSDENMDVETPIRCPNDTDSRQNFSQIKQGQEIKPNATTPTSCQNQNELFSGQLSEIPCQNQDECCTVLSSANQAKKKSKKRYPDAKYKPILLQSRTYELNESGFKSITVGNGWANDFSPQIIISSHHKPKNHLILTVKEWESFKLSFLALDYFLTNETKSIYVQFKNHTIQGKIFFAEKNIVIEGSGGRICMQRNIFETLRELTPLLDASLICADKISKTLQRIWVSPTDLMSEEDMQIHEELMWFSKLCNYYPGDD